MAKYLLWLMIAASIGAPLAGAAEARQERIARLQRAVLAPCCYQEAATHQSEVALKMRLEIKRGRMRAGTTDEANARYDELVGSNIPARPLKKARVYGSGRAALQTATTSLMFRYIRTTLRRLATPWTACLAASLLVAREPAPQHALAGSDQHTHGQPAAQEQQQGMQNMPGMHNQDVNPAEMFLMNESSGTGFQPSEWPMPMAMTRAGDWRLMWMAQTFIVDTQQTGPRGGDKFYSSNWGMLGAIHKLAGGSLMLRSMLSLEPATVTNRRYPLLLQTGETAFGIPLVDAQHPHDFVMELSAQYARPLGENGTWNIYYAPVGDPALGPVAYPHRASAMELPQASLGHHWQDSTHIANNVLTAGVTYRKVRIEASGFYGREPDEGRWNIDWGSMNSWSSRLSVFPAKNWTAQVSVGRLQDPEASHPGAIVRTTASIEYVRPAAGQNWWATSFAWGQNYKLDGRRRTNSALAETVVPFRRRNFLTGRFEWSQRDELFEYNHALAAQVTERTGQHAFNVSGFTAGYTRDVPLFRGVQTGVGANATVYAVACALKPYDGDHPWGVNVFIRVRLKPNQ